MPCVTSSIYQCMLVVLWVCAVSRSHEEDRINTLSATSIPPEDTTQCLRFDTSNLHANMGKMPQNQDKLSRTIQVVALLPDDNDQRLFSMKRVAPALKYALNNSQVRERLPFHSLVLHLADTKCNTAIAPIQAFKFYMCNHVDVFLGPVCDYSLAPVARYAPFWNLPVITPGAMAHDFGKDKIPEYKSLTRIGATFNSLGRTIHATLNYYSMNSVKVVYQTENDGGIIRRFCWLAISGVINHFRKTNMDFHLYLFKQEDLVNFKNMLVEEIGAKYGGRSCSMFYPRTTANALALIICGSNDMYYNISVII